ncbi:DUF4148 domain-containing protein [Paraburkholderia sp.]|uniref:DUF4148 domain-containing protein n=1 Tax=Paraburkholderia sp. TaxID=1926495 RepID=UPI00239F9C8B|nr:DUF4148 domain-containing protein [Paraburkholderia sp.]MDE1180569.1 DUF4148 domain-containing protein [Paraburkholderia sp.]
MKSLIQAVVVAVAFAAPVAVFAQSNQPLTRAEVRAQLVQLEKAGYNPGISDPHYPQNLQAAQARVDAQQGANVAVGGVNSGTSASGSRAPLNDGGVRPVYFGQ